MDIKFSKTTAAFLTILALVAVLPPALIILARQSEPGEIEIVFATPTAAADVTVHVAGAVARPGVYSLASGSRVADAVAQAGGFAENAAQDGINQARILRDQEQIHVPTVIEFATTLRSASPIRQPDLININTATIDDLDTLPEIGPAIAARIVAYREAKGRFKRADDLLNVSGIGLATLEKIRELITVD